MFWFQQRLFDEQLRIKVGKVEPKSEFFAPENARNHLEFSTERSPTIIAQGPPSMSLNVFHTPNDRFSLGLGVYDAAWNEGRDENTMTLHTPPVIWLFFSRAASSGARVMRVYLAESKQASGSCRAQKHALTARRMRAALGATT